MAGAVLRLTAECCSGVLEVTTRAHFCKIEGRVLGGMQFGVPVQLFAIWGLCCCIFGGTTLQTKSNPIVGFC